MFLVIFLQLICGLVTANAQNPFLPNNTPDRVSPNPVSQNSFLTKIALYQQQLKQKMAALIRQAMTAESIRPIFTVLMIAFGYGILHAAGPGHGKAVAMFYILSRNSSIASGLLFGTLIAFFHGFSGAICVLGLHYVLQKSVSGTLGTVYHTTQIVSFSLIALLGFGILVKNGYKLFLKSESSPNPPKKKSKAFKKGLLPWAVGVGLVPCPGVVMVMLFCLSMDSLTLGLLLAVFISLGMATTVSFVVIAVVIGKGISLRTFSTKRTERVESLIGVVSGLAVTALGVLFLTTTIG